MSSGKASVASRHQLGSRVGDRAGDRAGDRVLGLVLAALAALFASSAGLLVRHIEAADGWLILFYRSLAFSALVLLFVLASHRKGSAEAFRAVGKAGIVVAFSLGFAFLAFVFALLSASVATAVAVLSVSPFLAGLIGWLALGERPALHTWIAMAVTVAGVFLVVWEGLEAGSGLGLAISGLACLGYAVAVVALRSGRDRDMSPAVCLSGLVACLVSFAMVGSLEIGGKDLVFALLLGTVQIGAQYILISVAARYVSAAEITLVMLLEVVLAPLWVWLFLGEEAGLLTLIGAAVIIAALAANALASARLVERP